MANLHSHRARKVMELNCWFCNTDNMVNVKEKEEWYCKKCDQYNGFTRSGDYNKEIAEMYANCTESSLPKHGNKRLGNKSSRIFFFTKKSVTLCFLSNVPKEESFSMIFLLSRSCWHLM